MLAVEQSPVEALEEALERIARLDPGIRAFVYVDAAGARRRAEQLERTPAERRGQLAGFTLGIKDLIDTGDMPTTYGSPIFAGHRPKRDASVVRRLRRAGAVVVGKTVTTEFATFDPPPTRNPWDLAHTPGGSSSGSAAAVAAGLVRAAVGTQTAGSVLRPASYCGVVGFMPSPGWIGRTGIFPCAPSLDRVGVMARDVNDLRPLLTAASGLDRADPASIRPPRIGRQLVRPEHLRIGVLTPLLEAAAPDMAAAVERVASEMAAEGAIVRGLPGSDLFEAGFNALHTMMRAEMAAGHADLYRRHRRRYGPRVAALLDAGRRIKATEYLAAMDIRRRYGAAVEAWFDHVDVVIAPAAVGAAERSHATVGDPRMNIPATFGSVPALTIPMALTDDGLPLGLQLIGRRNHDDLLLAIGRQVERLVDFRASPRVRSLAG